MATDVDDQRRAAAVTAYDAVRMPPRELDSVVALAAQLAGVPKATVNIITTTEQHQVAAAGFEPGVCSREDSMCNITLRGGAPVVVRDASADLRYAANPFVTGEIADVRFYASFPMTTSDGVPFGTLCVFDESPGSLSESQELGLATLAQRIVDVFEVRLRNRELALSLMEVQAVQAELERSNERLASFAGQVSHDLKTPLTSLSLSLTLIRGQLDAGEQLGLESVGLLDRAIKGSARMSDLIDDVLDFARLGGTLRSTEVDLDFVLGEVLQDLTAELEGVTLHIARLPVVLGDRSQLRAVLQNLVSNAAKYRLDGRPPEVSISSRHVQRAWRVEVTDNGRGVPPSERHRVFEPLARVDVDPGVEGSGIGLATCRRIVGAHGGRIGVDPTVTDGARFWFELPD